MLIERTWVRLVACCLSVGKVAAQNLADGLRVSGWWEVPGPWSSARAGDAGGFCPCGSRDRQVPCDWAGGFPEALASGAARFARTIVRSFEWERGRRQRVPARSWSWRRGHPGGTGVGWLRAVELAWRCGGPASALDSSIAVSGFTRTTPGVFGCCGGGSMCRGSSTVTLPTWSGGERWRVVVQYGPVAVRVPPWRKARVAGSGQVRGVPVGRVDGGGLGRGRRVGEPGETPSAVCLGREDRVGASWGLRAPGSHEAARAQGQTKSRLGLRARRQPRQRPRGSRAPSPEGLSGRSGGCPVARGTVSEHGARQWKLR
jgi:hypothetical protein